MTTTDKTMLTPRSLVASLLLGMDPARMRGADLVRWCALFDVAEGTTRVALSRMAERGELVNDRGRYELGGDLAVRKSEQDRAIAAPDSAAWDGSWSLLVAPRGELGAGDRARLRAALRALRYGELRDGLWTRPANLSEHEQPRRALELTQQSCDRWTGRPGRAVDIDALFGVVAWAERARELAAELNRSGSRLAAEAELLVFFEIAVASVRHLRSDPRLPAELLASDWPGDQLRAVYGRRRGEFAMATADWVRRGRVGETDRLDHRGGRP